MMTEPQTFLSIYDNEYAGRLGKRSEGFREIFRALEVQNKEFYRIVETGTTRKADNWEGDGQSTILFDKFVNFYDGAVFSCDIDPVAVGVARSLTSYKTHCVCSDSVRFLKHYSDLSGSDKQADLFYLDSFDLKLDDPFPSMFHHIKELLAIGSLRKGVVIAVDDNLVHNGQDIGKGKLVAEYFSNLGVDKLYDGYQSVWQV
jgi:hypothetical protein